MHNQKHRLRHTQFPRGSPLRWPLRESTSKPMALTPGRSMQRRLQANTTPLLFKSERPSNTEYVGALWSVTFQVRETKQRKEAERQQREGRHSGHGTIGVFGAPVPRDGQCPQHLARMGSPSSGKAAFLYPSSQKMAYLFQPCRCHVSPMSPRCKARKANSPHRYPPEASNHCVQGNFSGSKVN